MKGESVALTNLSRLWSVFSLVTLLNSSISLLISLEDLSSVHLEKWVFGNHFFYDYLPHLSDCLWIDSPPVGVVASFPDFAW